MLLFQIVSPFQQRAKTFKSELFDTAGVEEKLVKKDNDLLDMKKTMKLKVLFFMHFIIGVGFFVVFIIPVFQLITSIISLGQLASLFLLCV